MTLRAYFALTFAIAWILWIAAAWLPGQGGARQLLFLPGTFAPAFAALALTVRAQGRAGTIALLRRILLGDVKVRWYLFAVTYMAAVKLAVALVHQVTMGRWPQFGPEPWYVIAAAIPFSTPVQAGEEIGWRGFALPRLAERWGLGPASVILGVIWAAWHLPLFYISGTTTTGQSFLVYLLQVTALSVTVAWLYGQTGGSLLLVMLMHSAVNQSIGIVPSFVPGATNPWVLSPSPVAWFTVALLWVCAAYFLARMPRLRLTPTGADPPVTP